MRRAYKFRLWANASQDRVLASILETHRRLYNECLAMRRLDKAFRAFFRRCRSGEKPGYPRFKPQERFGSVEFKAYGDGI